MNLSYIQTEIFRKFMELEELLAPRCNWFITRNAALGFDIRLFVLSTDTSYKWDDPNAGKSGYFRWSWMPSKESLLEIKTKDQLDEQIARLWDDIPSCYKKENV